MKNSDRIVTIHQPEHMPWAGFFNKMCLADHYVYLDSVQYRKNYFQNRNKVIDRNSVVSWLTVPVRLKHGGRHEAISTISINNEHPWKKKYLGKISSCYSKFPFYHDVFPAIAAIVEENDGRLCGLNVAIINMFRSILGIDTKTSFSSDITTSATSSELLLNICQYHKASVYLSGPSGKDYLDERIFSEANIEIRYHDFRPPRYAMDKFEPGLSALDLVMRLGPESAPLIFPR